MSFKPSKGIFYHWPLKLDFLLYELLGKEFQTSQDANTTTPLNGGTYRWTNIKCTFQSVFRIHRNPPTCYR